MSLLALPVLVSGQSLSEAAKKEKERRQKVEQAGAKAKSYTQESVKEAPPLANDPNALNAPPASTPNASGSSKPDAAPSGATEAATRDAGWRARIDAARQRVDEARREYEYWQKHTLVPGYVLVDPNGGIAVSSIEELQAKTRAAKAKLDAAQAALADLLEQARRANVSPGALR